MKWTIEEIELIKNNAGRVKDEILLHMLTGLTGRKITLAGLRKQRVRLGLLKSHGRGLCVVKKIDPPINKSRQFILKNGKYNHILTKQFLEQEYLLNHKTYKEIANQLGITGTTVRLYIKKHNIPRFSMDHILTQEYLTTECLDKKRSIVSIAKELKISTAYVKKYLKKYSIIIPKKYGTQHLNWTGYQEITGTFWSQIKNGAKSRNLQFNITKEYIWDLFIKQNQKCALSGLDIFLNKTNRTASLDRIDSKLGYIENNVQWVHKYINIMKSTLSNMEFIQLCNLIINPKPPIDYKINNGFPIKLFANFFKQYKHNAIRRKIPFLITKDDAIQQFIKQNGLCAVTRQQLTIPTNHRCIHSSYNASLDRIDSKISYIPSNIQWVTKQINKSKNGYSMEYFKYLAELVKNNTFYT